METKAIIIGPAALAEEDEPPSPLYLSPASAGFPSPSENSMDGERDIHTHLVHNGASAFFLRTSGNAMTGAGLFDGDILVADLSLSPGHDRTVIAALSGELAVKRSVRPRNSVFDYPRIDIIHREHVYIWGVAA